MTTGLRIRTRKLMTLLFVKLNFHSISLYFSESFWKNLIVMLCYQKRAPTNSVTTYSINDFVSKVVAVCSQFPRPLNKAMIAR